jgi:PRTRC genetic system protein A
MELSSIFGSLVQYHPATCAAPLPPAQPGITWIWAQNGIFKRGVGPGLDLCIPVGITWPAPGLASLMAHVCFPDLGARLPGEMLQHVFEHALRASTGGVVARPIEQQYFLTYRAELPTRRLRIAVPEQDATAGHVRYQTNIPGRILVDLHSHHSMAAYFSGTDDRDDTGLSVSCVIGRIFTQPEIACRLNVYGHRYPVPPSLIFDGLGPFRPVISEERYAVITD